MKRTLLISVAAVALAAGSTVALSQGSGGGAGGAGGATMATPSAPSGGAGASGGAGMTAPSAQESAPGTQGAPAKGAQDRTAPQTQKSTQAPQGGQAPAARQSQDDKSGQPSTRQSQGEQQPSKSQQGQAPSAGGAKQGAAERPMTSSNVSLTTEQKTTIRTTVLTSSAPRVTNVNFDIKIGTAVPRNVRIVPLPVTLIEIQPSWRGYMYFVYNDEIIVVEPGTLRIVAVLEV
jgi:hypothetical protein